MDTGDDPCTCSTGELLHVALLDAAHGIDAGFGQIVLSQVVYALLDE